MRVIPDPDPMLGHIDAEDGPYAFWRLPHQQRGLVLRFYLVALCAGLHEVVAWHLAGESDEAALWEVVDQWPDERLVRAITDAAERRLAGRVVEYPFRG